VIIAVLEPLDLFICCLCLYPHSVQLILQLLSAAQQLLVKVHHLMQAVEGCCWFSTLQLPLL
jgi:hypothetical protein